MIESIVILTYPGHFYTTGVCLRRLQQYQDYDCTIYIVADDRSDLAWDTYLEDLHTYISHNTWHPFEIVPTSRLKFPLANSFSIGWIRQQIVKLHLDLLIPQHGFWCIDADVFLENTVDWYAVPYVIRNDKDQLYDEFTNYSNYMLGLDTTGYFYNGDRIDSSGIAYRFLDRNLLESIRDFVANIHGTNFMDLHAELILKDKLKDAAGIHCDMTISEWHLLETYKECILEQSPPRVLTPTMQPTDDRESKVGPRDYWPTCVSTFWGKDEDLGLDFIQSNRLQLTKKTG